MQLQILGECQFLSQINHSEDITSPRNIGFRGINLKELLYK
jgi:hypothetical protein